MCILTKCFSNGYGSSFSQTMMIMGNSFFLLFFHSQRWARDRTTYIQKEFIHLRRNIFCPVFFSYALLSLLMSTLEDFLIGQLF
jgi:hypothetical protein